MNIVKNIPFTYMWFLQRLTGGKKIKTVLDIGCGDGALMQVIKKSHWEITGIDIFQKSVKKAKKTGLYKEVLLGDIVKILTKLTKSKKKFDMVFCSQVIEHVTKEDGNKILELSEQLAKDHIYFGTPRGFLEQPEEFIEDNPYQNHKSGWSIKEFTSRGYKVYGIGFMPSWSEDGIARSKNTFTKYLGVALSYLLSPVSFFIPQIASGMMAVREKGDVSFSYLKMTFWVVLTFILGLMTLYPSLFFAVFGDDWIALHRALISYDSPGHPLSFYSYTGYFDPYGVTNWTVWMIHKFAGFTHWPYFATAFISRLLASIGLFILVNKVSKSYFAAGMASIYFMVGYSGIETVNWGPFNQPAYWVVFFLSLCLYFLLDSYTSIKKFSLSLLFALFAIVSFPVRSHGLILLYTFADLLWLILNFSKKNLITWVVRQLVYIAFFIPIILIGTFGPVGALTGWLNSEIVVSTQVYPPHTWISLLTNYGKLIFPDPFLSSGSVNKFLDFIFGQSNLFPKTKTIFVLFASFSLLLSIISCKRWLRVFILSLVLGLVWTYFFKYVLSISPQRIHLVNLNFTSLSATFIGGYVWSWLFSYALNVKTKRRFFEFALIASWPIIFFATPWIRSYFAIVPSDMRYMIVPHAGIALLIGTLMGYIRSSYKKVTFFALVSILIAINIIASHSYLNSLSKTRNSKLYDTLWSQFFEQTQYNPDGQFQVFYFESSTPNVIYNVFHFGFWPKLGVLYHLPESDPRLPVSYDIYADFEKVVNGGYVPGLFVMNHGILPPERWHAFRIENDKLIDIEDEVLVRLRKNGYPK